MQVEALNREKALVPPVVLTLPKHLRGVGEAQLEALSNKLSLILQALQRERQSKTDTMLSYILLLLLLQQQHIREQQQYLLLLQQQQQQQHNHYSKSHQQQKQQHTTSRSNTTSSSSCC